MEGLISGQYKEVVRLFGKMLPMGGIAYGIIEAFDTDNRLMKLTLEPEGEETGWCRVLQGAFCDKIGAAALSAVLRGNGADEYIVIGIIE